ncbi:MAG: competence protein ComEA [Fusobacteria bacterium]|nr:MAG: competence protein ComEA [Fusobacteriota bacterium]KAF0230026.1 MAG: competence protein [Fusobacteriota bacterium]
MNRFMALDKKYQMTSLFILIFLIVTLGYYLGRTTKYSVFANEKPSNIIVEDKNNNSVDDEKLVVNIKGAVKNPGIYEFPLNSRVNDALEKAEPLENADLLPLNLAMFLKDEQDIYVPFIDAVNEGEVNGEGNNDELISINKASAKDLELVPGIGPVMASNILEYRKSIVRYQTLEELLNVSGIGEKTLEKMRPYIKL